MSQAERRAETRAALVAAAADLFADQGFDAVSVDAVAAAAGRTSGAVYDHFGSKQGLLLAVLDDWAQSLVSLLAAEFERSATLEARLQAVAANVIVHPSERTRRLLLLEHELALRAARDAEVAAALRARSRDAHRRLARGFERWVADGVLPRGPGPDALAINVRALVLGMVMQARLEPGAFDVDRAAALLEAGLVDTKTLEAKTLQTADPTTRSTPSAEETHPRS